MEIFSDIIDKKLCESYIAKLEKILELRNNDNEYIGDKTNQVLYTFFKEDLTLSNLITLPIIDEIAIFQGLVVSRGLPDHLTGLRSHR